MQAMTDSPPAFPRPPAHIPVHPVLWVMVGIMVLLELLPVLADRGVVSPIFHRVWVYTFFAFFDGQFELARHGIAVEPQLIWSLVTHAFVHGGWVHLGLNAAIFLALGHTISRAVGLGRMLAVFGLSAAAGAIAFGIIQSTQFPLVGASGAVFGMLGMVIAWRWRQFGMLGISRSTLVRLLVGLAVINVVVAFGFAGMGGQLAWEAHLGGFLMGWLLGSIWQPGFRIEALR